MTVTEAQSPTDFRATRVLDTLDRWSDRLQGHFTQKREFPRRRFRTKVTVYLDGNSGVGESAQSTSVDVWSRNISQGGLCFVYTDQIEAVDMIVCLDAQGDGRLWYSAEVVRSRPVHDGFWEFGIRFKGSAQI